MNIYLSRWPVRHLSDQKVSGSEVAAGQALAGSPQPFSPSSQRLAALFETGCRYSGTTTVAVLGAC